MSYYMLLDTGDEPYGLVESTTNEFYVLVEGQWFLAGGIQASDVFGAWTAKGAASVNASIQNEVPGVALPDARAYQDNTANLTWASSTGYTFTATNTTHPQVLLDTPAGAGLEDLWGTATSKFTMITRFKSSNITSGNHVMILSSYYASGSARNLMFRSSLLKPSLTWYQDGGTSNYRTYATTNTELTANTDHVVAMNFDNTQTNGEDKVTFYVDGVKKTTDSTPMFSGGSVPNQIHDDTTMPLGFGVSVNTHWIWSTATTMAGEWYGCAVYKRCLTDAEHTAVAAALGAI